MAFGREAVVCKGGHGSGGDGGIQGFRGAGLMLRLMHFLVVYVIKSAYITATDPCL